MSDKRFRWGYVGTGGIVRRNWEAARLSGNGRVAAVASRDLQKARDFISERQTAFPFDQEPVAFGSYEELIASPEIDAVYVGLPTGLRKKWVILAAQAGKHVLGEKPCASTFTDLEEMIAACREKHVLFMDGVMFMHSARLPKLREVLDDGESVGRLRRVSSAFSFNGSPEFLATNIRTDSTLEPAGALGDLGWYNIRLALWAAKGELPVRVSGQILEEVTREGSAEAVPISFSGEMEFAGGLSSSFYCSFTSGRQQWARFDGEKGTVMMDDFVLPAETAGPVGFFSGSSRIEVDEVWSNDPTWQAAKLFRNFADLARSGQDFEPWADIALKTQRVVEALVESAREGRAVELL